MFRAILNRYHRKYLTATGRSSWSNRTYASCATSLASCSLPTFVRTNLIKAALCSRKRREISATRAAVPSGVTRAVASAFWAFDSVTADAFDAHGPSTKASFIQPPHSSTIAVAEPQGCASLLELPHTIGED